MRSSPGVDSTYMHIFLLAKRFEPNSNCKHDSARSHLQPWPEDLKLYLVIDYLTQHHE